jgi:hypothetical protein
LNGRDNGILGCFTERTIGAHSGLTSAGGAYVS